MATIDFYNRILLGRTGREELSDADERLQVFVSRLLTLLIGAVGVALSCSVDRLGTIFEIANKLVNSFTGPMLGIFLLGMFTKRATALGAFVGGSVGTGVTLYVVYLSSLEVPRISFLWPSTFGLVTTLILGYLCSLATGPRGMKGLPRSGRYQWMPSRLVINWASMLPSLPGRDVDLCRASQQWKRGFVHGGTIRMIAVQRLAWHAVT